MDEPGQAKGVAGAAPARRVFGQDPPAHEFADVAQRGVVRALLECRPLRRRELAVEAIEQPVHDVALPLVDRRARVLLPEPRLAEEHLGAGLRAGPIAGGGVRAEGDAALLDYARRFDGVDLSGLETSAEELAAATARLTAVQRQAIDRAITNVRAFHAAQRGKPLVLETSPGVVCERHEVPIGAVGLYVPAGSAPLPSAAIMLAVPAELAGCPVRVLCTPPRPDGHADPDGNPDAGGYLNGDADPDGDPHTHLDRHADNHPYDGHAYRDPYADGDPDAYRHPDRHAHTNGDADGDGDPDAHVDANAHDDTDPNPDANGEYPDGHCDAYANTHRDRHTYRDVDGDPLPNRDALAPNRRAGFAETHVPRIRRSRRALVHASRGRIGAPGSVIESSRNCGTA